MRRAPEEAARLPEDHRPPVGHVGHQLQSPVGSGGKGEADADSHLAAWDDGEGQVHDTVSGLLGAPVEGLTSTLEANQQPRPDTAASGPPNHPFLLFFSPLLVYLSHVTTCLPRRCRGACGLGMGWKDTQPGRWRVQVARGTASVLCAPDFPWPRASAWDSWACAAGPFQSWCRRPPGGRSVPVLPHPCQLLVRSFLLPLAF